MGLWIPFMETAGERTTEGPQTPTLRQQPGKDAAPWKLSSNTFEINELTLHRDKGCQSTPTTGRTEIRMAAPHECQT